MATKRASPALRAQQERQPDYVFDTPGARLIVEAKRLGVWGESKWGEARWGEVLGQADEAADE